MLCNAHCNQQLNQQDTNVYNNANIQWAALVNLWKTVKYFGYNLAFFHGFHALISLDDQ